MAGSHIFQEGESVIRFDTQASPIQASWKMHREGSTDPAMLDIYGDVTVDLKMVKVADR